MKFLSELLDLPGLLLNLILLILYLLRRPFLLVFALKHLIDVLLELNLAFLCNFFSFCIDPKWTFLDFILNQTIAESRFAFFNMLGSLPSCGLSLILLRKGEKLVVIWLRLNSFIFWPIVANSGCRTDVLRLGAFLFDITAAFILERWLQALDFVRAKFIQELKIIGINYFLALITLIRRATVTH